jgi:hypothetical protein
MGASACRVAITPEEEPLVLPVASEGGDTGAAGAHWRLGPVNHDMLPQHVAASDGQ